MHQNTDKLFRFFFPKEKEEEKKMLDSAVRKKREIGKEEG